MGLTRKALIAMGIEEEKAAQICEWHGEDMSRVNDELKAAKANAEKFKEDSEKLAKVEKELSDLKEKEAHPDAFKEKYDKLKKEYDTYKGEVTAKETKAAKSKAYRDMLKDIGISEKRLDSVMRVADLDSIELDEDGNIKDVDNLKTSAKSEWADFIVSTGRMGAETPTPPSGTDGKGGAKTKKEIMAISDYEERQKAIADNHELFGF